MARRTHACVACHGSRRTRHDDGVCSWCRRRGIHVRDGHVVVPIVINYRGRGA